MSASLSRDELDVISRLRRSGISAPSATLAVVMVTREHARPEHELLDIVRQYQGLEDPKDVSIALQDLRERGWLVETRSYGQIITNQVNDLRDRIAVALGDPDVSGKLSKMRATLEPSVRILGPMNDKFVYDSYLDLLRGAQREICLPMLATTPRLSSVPILQERARKGVRIRILLGSQEVVRKLRGETMVEVARDAIRGWSENARGIAKMEVRIAHSEEDMLIATCMTIDSKLLRFDIYDPTSQRSLQGVMIEVESPDGHRLNLPSLVQGYFDNAWNRAEPIDQPGRATWYFGRGWQWWAFLVFTALTLATATTAWASILGSVAATFLVNALASTRARIRSLFGRLV